MKFKYFRFLLTPMEQPSLLTHGEPISREDLIHKIFNEDKQYTFVSWKREYVFVVRHKEGNLVEGTIGKRSVAHLHHGPSENFAEKTEKDWPINLIYLNLSDEKDRKREIKYGQIIAFQVNSKAASNPNTCLASLAKEINKEIIDFGYHITINPILSGKKRFWPMVKKYEGEIKRIVLVYTPPNILDLRTKLEDMLRKAQEMGNVQKVRIDLDGDGGIVKVPKDDFFNQSAEYIDEGGGSFKMYRINKSSIDSATGVETKRFTDRSKFEDLTKNELERIRTVIYATSSDEDVNDD